MRPPIDLHLPDLPGALCVEVDPEAFHPERGGEVRTAAPAKAVCVQCPEQDPCLSYALSNYVEGVWGGTTTDERDATRKRLGIRAEPMQGNRVLSSAGREAANRNRRDAGVDNRKTVLKMHADGVSIRRIAELMRLSPRTVQRHVSDTAPAHGGST